MSTFGHFSNDDREFVITNPRTPSPWVNYMWNHAGYAGLVSHCGGGYSYFISPRDNRLTRFRYNALPWDQPGRYVYVRDAESGKYWSLSWGPTHDAPYSFYECRHGQGYTAITTEAEEIRGTITYFVPPDDAAEVWLMSLKNNSHRERTLDVFSYVELLMGNALNDLINQCNDKHFSDVYFNDEIGGLLCSFQVRTPDADFDAMINMWNRYQTAVTFDMARNAGYYNGGLLFGIGIRDQMQDMWGSLMSEPGRVRERILEVAGYQFADGSTLHNFFRISHTGEKTGHSDTPLWLPLGIVMYLKETGDFDILKEVVSYYDKGKGSLEQHLCRALDYSISQLTKRNLPKFGPGDWNDTLDYVGRGGKGETVWGAGLFSILNDCST
jgi:cellobiose phosphorylase